MRVSDLLFLGLGSVVVGSPLGSHVLHEKRDALPVAWTKHSRAPKDTILPVRIGLTQRNLEHSDRYLDDISDPESSNFGKNPCSKRFINVAYGWNQESTGLQSGSRIRLRHTQRPQRQPSSGCKTQALISSE